MFFGANDVFENIDLNTLSQKLVNDVESITGASSHAI